MSCGNPFKCFAFQGPLARHTTSPTTDCNVTPEPLRLAPNNTIGAKIGGRQHGRHTDDLQGIARLTASADPACNGGTDNTPSERQAKRKRQRSSHTPLSDAPTGLPEKLGTGPLRLILVGHNPSEHAWQTGHYYSNPSNRMWPILVKTGIAPAGTTGCQADDSMPGTVGVGFTDVGSGQPGTDSSTFTTTHFQQWRLGFYSRLQQHVAQASSQIGCTCGQCGAPAIIAFTGKRHYMELLNLDVSGHSLKGKARVSPAAVQLGMQPPNQLPSGWPLPTDKTKVWVLTSTSGAAPMSNADREAPYAQLAESLRQIPWPRSNSQLHCTNPPANTVCVGGR